MTQENAVVRESWACMNLPREFNGEAAAQRSRTACFGPILEIMMAARSYRGGKATRRWISATEASWRQNLSEFSQKPALRDCCSLSGLGDLRIRSPERCVVRTQILCARNVGESRDRVCRKTGLPSTVSGWLRGQRPVGAAKLTSQVCRRKRRAICELLPGPTVECCVGG